MTQILISPMKSLLLFLIILLLSPPLLHAQNQENEERAREIFEEFEQRRQTATNEIATLEMAIIDSRGRTRNRTLQSWQYESGSDSKSLLLFKAPADVRGTGLLSVNENGSEQQWLYLPAVGRVQTVSGSQRTDRFVGSDFTFEDLGAQNPDNFDLSLIEENDENFIIKGIPVQESQYAYIHFFIDAESFALNKAEYYDDSDTKIKKLTTYDHQEYSENNIRPAKMIMRDLKENRRTELTWQDRSFPDVIDAGIFTERRLRRGL